MNFEIGQRVHFTGNSRIDPMDVTIVRFYEGTFRALVRADTKPEYWPYPTLELAPLLSELEKINDDRYSPFADGSNRR